MKFIVTRSSARGPVPGSPCPGAVQSKGNWWLELATLEDLCALLGEEDSLMFYRRGDDLEIDIYDESDDYIE